MTPPRSDKTPAAFRVALEDRLKKRAAARKIVLNRVRQRFVMERFLARVVAEFADAATLKGGLALELRLDNARSTKDVDLRAVGSVDAVFTRLQRAASQDPGDWLEFADTADPDHPEIAEAVYDGRRFRVTPRLGSVFYGSPFGVDVAMGDPMYGAPEILAGEDFLDFVGIATMRVPAYPAATHIAEKLHAYTRPPTLPGRENSRVRDLPDLALLARTGVFIARDLRAALQTTFSFRKTHAVPAAVPPPPASWARPYAALADENALPWPDLDVLHGAVCRFLDPVLGGKDGRWDPLRGDWTGS